MCDNIAVLRRYGDIMELLRKFNYIQITTHNGANYTQAESGILDKCNIPLVEYGGGSF